MDRSRKTYNSKNYREIPPLPRRGDVAPSKPRDTTCIHRGEPLGNIDCGCGSVNRQTTVYACPIFTACTLTALGGRSDWTKLGIKTRPAYCVTCEERKP